MSLRRILQWLTLCSVAGLGISMYLTAVYMSGAAIICGTSGGCATVQHSAYAWIAGIPIPMLGAVSYSVLIALAIMALQWDARREIALQALLGVALVGVGFSAWLTYVELWILDAICRWCVASAVVMVVVLSLAIWAWRLYQTEAE